ncbi:RDD family protein [Nonlabens ponticola]|uniref:RDD family protein n=1 Tax=Nonlabens ponticola TaxID=2496866 RepID=A0A3S9MZ82_9FLAO|nr:RDD family protein [Nonlabens ponticola]AZQ44490.1 RDD family protein [Nonlabens ponticola]
MSYQYASLPDRIKAAIIDGIILIIAMYLTTDILSRFDHVSDFVRITIFVILFFLYDPLMVSIFGGTLGHLLSDISVKKHQDETTNINFIKSIVRFFLKITLGWLSLLTVTGNERKQAIHDLAVGSVVLRDV